MAVVKAMHEAHFIPLEWLLQEGLIINIGSIAGLEPMKSTPVYAASKWGLRGWSVSCYDVSAFYLITIRCHVVYQR